MSRYFIELTQPEIKAQFERHPLVILPCGSVEQHGPHLPLQVDAARGERPALEVAGEALHGQCSAWLVTVHRAAHSDVGARPIRGRRYPHHSRLHFFDVHSYFFVSRSSTCPVCSNH